jgi:hypothetical protein
VGGATGADAAAANAPAAGDNNSPNGAATPGDDDGGSSRSDDEDQPVDGTQGEGKPSTAGAAAAAATPDAAVGDAAAGAKTGGVPVCTPALLASAWLASDLHASRMANADDAKAAGAAGPPPTLELTSDFARAQYGRAFAHSALLHFWHLLRRQLTLTGRSKAFVIFRGIVAFFNALVLGGSFFQLALGEGITRFGLFQFSSVQLSFINMGEMTMVLSDRRVYYKQAAASWYPGVAYILAIAATHVPIALVESVIFSIMVYFMAGLTLDAGRFFFFVFVSECGPRGG